MESVNEWSVILLRIRQDNSKMGITWLMTKMREVLSLSHSSVFILRHKIKSFNLKIIEIRLNDSPYQLSLILKAEISNKILRIRTWPRKYVTDPRKHRLSWVKEVTIERLHRGTQGCQGRWWSMSSLKVGASNIVSNHSLRLLSQRLSSAKS